MAFLESRGFEDAVRNAISLGGDSDTLAAITGGIAEALHGVSEGIMCRTMSFPNGTLSEIVARFYAAFPAGE